MARVLVSPLSWGLGHATRDVPVIKELLSRGHEVTIAGCGRALALLRGEFPECRFEVLEDYPAPYSASRFFLPKFLANIPSRRWPPCSRVRSLI
jgi:UDP:flavonoid glycosyltransferase YjiC (YdhE family)